MNSTFVKNFIKKFFFTSTERIKFWKRVSKQMQYGLGLQNILISYREYLMRKNSPVELLFDDIIERYETYGDNFVQAMSPYISFEEQMLLEAGQRAGTLSNNMNLCVQLLTSQNTMSKVLITAMAYPIMLLCMFLGLLVMLSYYVIPELANFLEPELWAGPAKALYIVSNFVASKWFLIALVFVFVMLGLSIYSLPRWTGDLRQYVEKLPPWSFYRIMTGSVWLLALSIIMQTNTPVGDIFSQMLKSSSTSVWLKDKLRKIKLSLDNGKKLGVSLHETQVHFPDEESIEEIMVYEELPSFNRNLYNIAQDKLQETQENINTKAKVGSSLLMGLIILFLLMFAISFGSIQQQLTGSFGI